MEQKKELSFEEMLTRLAEIVKILEQGGSELEESLKLYTEGAELVRLCTARLDKAEQTVMMLRRGSDGSPEEIPFKDEEI